MSYTLDFAEMDNELDEFIERTRQERVALGLPADPPEPFVPMAITCALMERIMPLRDIVIKYALLVNNAKKVLPIDAEGLRKIYGDDLALLSQSVGILSSLTGYTYQQSIDAIEQAQQDTDLESAAEVAEDLVKTIYLNLELSKAIPSLDDLNIEDSAEDAAEFERLKPNEALLCAEIEKYRQKYESIKHLL